tara:strand:- start:227 stop:391 length:165 start_codon:yes stop_codon:yes gene_type:complete
MTDTKSAPELLVALDALIQDLRANPNSAAQVGRLLKALPKDAENTLRKVLGDSE